MTFQHFCKKLNAGGRPLLAVLIDPDKFNPDLVRLARKSGVSCFLVGGSKLETGDTAQTVTSIKRLCPGIPVVLFPGDESQLTPKADGLLLLSLLSGRNPEYLIEKQVRSAPLIKKMKLPVLPTAYLLIDGGRQSATQKITGTLALDPARRSYIAATALAAQQLGFGAVYLEAGSGARRGVSTALIRAVRRQIDIPLIVGGGIDSPVKAKLAKAAGANLVVIGNAFEKNVFLLPEIGKIFQNY